MADQTHENEKKWTLLKDEEGNEYYYNEVTQETQWEKPAGFDESIGATVKESKNDISDETHENKKKWTTLKDEEGNQYYYNEVTGETQWENPSEEEVLCEDGNFSEDKQQPDTDGLTKWIAHRDDEGREYYYNSETGETQWEKPVEGAIPVDDATSSNHATEHEMHESAEPKWISHKDDEGREYYYNNETGETQWEKPEGANIVDAEALENEEVAESKATGDANEIKPRPEPMKPDEGSPEGAVVMEEVDPAVKRLQEAEAFLGKPDSILEPQCFTNVTEVVKSENGNPAKALNLLVENYHSQTGVCGLLGRWLSAMKAVSGPKTSSMEESSEATNNEIRKTAQDVICRVAKERFSKETGDTSILNLKKTQATFLEDMIDSSRWRKLLIDLSASHKESQVLKYCLQTISKRGHHREIARRINQSDHFAVFRQMLQSELAIIGKLAVSAGNDVTTSIGMKELVNDLRRACTSTSYTYLYSLEVLRALEQRAENLTESTEQARRAFRKWEFLREYLENSMTDPSLSTTIAGSSPLFRKRRLDIALTISELNQRQRRRFVPPNGHEERKNDHDGLETAVLNLLRRHAIGIQIDDSVLDPLLPSGLGDGTAIGALLIRHSLAIRAMLGCLYKPGTGRVISPVVKNKCARLVALAVVAAEQKCVNLNASFERSDEVAATRMILQGCQLCEELENMVSFLVSDGGRATATPSPGLKLCKLATNSAVVAQGTMTWVKDLTQNAEFPTSASFPTLSVSLLSLVRRIALAQPFTRRDALDVALAFTKHVNSDVSYQKMNQIKEQSVRIMLCLISEGEVSSVLAGVSARLQQQPQLDASLVRYFVAGLLDIVKTPVSLAFARILAEFLRLPKCVDAVRSAYFEALNKARLETLLRSFESLPSETQDEPSRKVDKSWVESVLTTYRLDK